MPGQPASVGPVRVADLERESGPRLEFSHEALTGSSIAVEQWMDESSPRRAFAALPVAPTCTPAGTAELVEVSGLRPPCVHAQDRPVPCGQPGGVEGVDKIENGARRLLGRALAPNSELDADPEHFRESDFSAPTKEPSRHTSTRGRIEDAATVHRHNMISTGPAIWTLRDGYSPFTGRAG